MRIGRLDRRVRIEYQQPQQLGDGHLTDNWLTLVEVWAERVDDAGNEAFNGTVQARASQSTRTYRIRWRAGVTPRMRVREGADLWNIEAVIEEGRRDTILLTCTAFEVASGNIPEIG